MTASSAFLAGDIGGTKTLLALYASQGSKIRPIVEETFASKAYADLESIVEEFRTRHPAPITAAALAVAGPVLSGRASVTNLPWTIDATALETRFGIQRVQLLNDLEALAFAVPHLPAASLHTLSEGEPVAQGVMAVLAPGTGLGEAFLSWNGGDYAAHPTEGGHADFAPTDPVQVRLLEFMWKQFPHVSVERVCSGSGLPNLYRFLRDSSDRIEDVTALRLESSEDPTPGIIDYALRRESSLCVRTLELFVEILGAEAGNLALKTLATGGLYLGGGIPPRIIPFLESGRFLEALRAKGRFTALLSRLPVHIILDTRAVLQGAARRAQSCHAE